MSRTLRPLRLALLVGLLALPLLLAGCPRRGGDTPMATFELARSWIEKGEYERVWSLYTRRYKDELAGELARQKAGVRQELAGGPNREESERLIRRQYGLGLEEFLAAAPEDLHARMLEFDRARALGLEVVGEAVVTGDRARIRAKPKGEGFAPVDFILVRSDGGWLIDGTEGR